MNDRDDIQRFNQELDQLLGVSDVSSDGLQTQRLVVLRLAQADFSADSRQRQALRRRLLAQARHRSVRPAAPRRRLIASRATLGWAAVTAILLIGLIWAVLPATLERHTLSTYATTYLPASSAPSLGHGQALSLTPTPGATVAQNTFIAQSDETAPLPIFHVPSPKPIPNP
jgi:hypothetical protein